MSHTFRFIASRPPGNFWELSGEEAHHLAKVLRLDLGTTVEVCDGAGLWATGTVESIAPGGKTVSIATNGELKIEKAPAWPLHLCLGAQKPGSIDDLLPSLVELGTDTLHVFQQEGSAKSRLAGSAVDRWHRIIAGAIKQCKRARLPEVVVHQSAAELATAIPSSIDRFVMDPTGPATLASLLSRTPPTSGAALVIGGEKGLSPAEHDALTAAGFTGARLGSHVLRAYTAAIAACSVAVSVRDH